MKFLRLLLLAVLVCLGSGWAQEYLFDDIEPPDEASELPTPFSPLKAVDPEGLLGTTSSEPFLRDLTFSLRPRFFYRSVRNAAGVQDTFAAGGAAGVTSGWFRDTVQIGVTGYMTQPLVAVQTNNRSGLVESDGQGFFTLGEAWMKLRAGTATATLFRQRLNLPFINMNDSRMIPNTFEAYQVDAKLWRILRLNLGYIAQMKGRNTPDFVPMSEAAGAPDVDRGTSFGGFVAGDEKKTYLAGMTQTTWDLFNCVYVQAGHTWEVTPDFELRADVQFSDQRNVGASYIGDFETQLYGGQLTASYCGALLSLAGTKTAAGASLLQPFGADPAFNRLMISNFASEDELSWGVHVSYDFSKLGLPGLSAFGSWVYGDLDGNNWEREVNVTVDYRMREGLLKNLWLRLRYAYNESTVGAPIEDFRVILNYSVSF